MAHELMTMTDSESNIESESESNLKYAQAAQRLREEQSQYHQQVSEEGSPEGLILAQLESRRVDGV